MSTALRDKFAAHQQRELEGNIEEVGTVTVDGNDLYFIVIRPPGEARSTGIVICHSYFELSLLQAAEISFAREAARAGFACIYIQAPGMGDSRGVPQQCMVSDRIATARAGWDELARRVPAVSEPCFFGARLGGLVATLAAAETPGSNLVLWDPNFDSETYWKQVRRLARVSAVVGRMNMFQDPQIDIDQEGEASVLGVEVTRAQLADISTSAGRLTTAKVDGAGVLVSMDAGSMRSASGTLSGIVQGPLETHSLGNRDIWGLGLRRGRGAIEPTVAWLKENLD